MDKYKLIEMIKKLPDRTDVMVMLSEGNILEDSDARKIISIEIDPEEYKGGNIAYIRISST